MKGFDTGIATTSKYIPCIKASYVFQVNGILAIAHKSWVAYMNHPSHGLTGAVSAGPLPVNSI